MMGMTTEIRTTIQLSDVKAIEFECHACRCRIVRPVGGMQPCCLLALSVEPHGRITGDRWTCLPRWPRRSPSSRRSINKRCPFPCAVRDRREGTAMNRWQVVPKAQKYTAKHV